MLSRRIERQSKSNLQENKSKARQSKTFVRRFVSHDFPRGEYMYRSCLLANTDNFRGDRDREDSGE